MAIEYTYYGSAAALPSTVSTVLREGLSLTAHRVKPGDEATAPGLFGFPHRVTVRFRFSAALPDLEEHNTAFMVGVVLDLAQTDGVLLFNGEEAVIQTTAGAATFATGWDGWDDMPEVLALKGGHRSAPLTQPLL